MNRQDWVRPGWPAPRGIIAGSTTRLGGHSQGCYGSFNLALHVGDKEQAVLANRQMLQLPAEPVWLEQCHSQVVVRAEDVAGQVPRADACYTSQPGLACIVMTADCLPLLITDRQGQHVAAIHAGWRGLAGGIIENTLECLPVDNPDLMVWLGPAIGPRAYEVGAEVRQAFVEQSQLAEQAFEQVDEQHWLMDIYQLARQRLQAQQVSEIYGGDLCTYSDSARFYSYRRDGDTGRMASFIFLNE